jgi:alkanesulfonate monooxygenase SsuD/methylene tetrahydromethanopterin reductase-like flavin-dependent oxidoreductase (luciferase family)
MQMQLGVFIPIGNNGWLISTTSPQYMPTFDLNRAIVEKAERFGFDFALSMIKLHGFGGPSQFWEHNLESFTLMAGLAPVTTRIQLFATCAVLTMPPPIAARMAVTIDSISHGRFGVNIISGWQRREYSQMGILARRRALPAALRVLRRIRDDHARAVGDGSFRLQRQLLQHGRLSLQSASHVANSYHLRGAKRCRNALCRGACGLQFLRKLRREPTQRRRR